MDISQSQHYTSEALQAFFEHEQQRATAIHPNYARLIGQIERVALAGGKRLRPHLVYIGYGSYDPAIIPVATAYELLHVALLIHDDIIDRDQIRHHQPTIHHAYATTHYAHLTNPAERLHFSQSAALLAGDVLISAAYEQIATSTLLAEQRLTAQTRIAKAIFAVAGGELLDTEAPFNPTPIDPLCVYRHKTASYSFVGPLLAGAELSPHAYSKDILASLEEGAIHLGLAFQIQDDFLGVFGDEATTGKSSLGDLREGKQTLLVSTFYEQASSEQRRLFDASFGRSDVSDAALGELKTLLQYSGAAKRTSHAEEVHLETARQCFMTLEGLPLYEPLMRYIEQLESRRA